MENVNIIYPELNFFLSCNLFQFAISNILDVITGTFAVLPPLSSLAFLNNETLVSLTSFQRTQYLLATILSANLYVLHSKLRIP